MEAPTGPLRSPDGLWWWDGKSWQPIATLGASPSPPAGSPPPAGAEPAIEAGPATGAWEPPAAPWQPPSDGWQPPPPPTDAPAAEQSPAAAGGPPPPGPPQPTEKVASFDASQPPSGTSQPSSGTAQPSSDPWELPAAARAEPSLAPPPHPSPTAWQPPPGVAATQPQSPEPLKAGAGPPAGATPKAPPSVTPPPPAPAGPPAPPAPDVPWPNWLPRTERSEAVVEDVPSRVDPVATKVPPPASAGPTAPVPVPDNARPSSWVSQLYPARAALNANRQLAIYVGLGILGLIALFVLFQVLSQMNLFGGGGGTTAVDTGPTGTQFQQAEGYLKTLNPILTSVDSAVKPIPTDCIGAHSVTCRNTLENADTSVVNAIAVIDKGNFPNCLAASVVQTRHDLVLMDQAMKAALIGFRSNSDALITKGLADFAAASPTLKSNRDALTAAEQSACPKTP